MDVRIERLTPGLVDDFLGFFDRVAFSDNPGWAKCYCQFFLLDCADEAWARRTAAENRQATRDLIAAGRMHGYLAYAGADPVGWCHADDMAGLARLADDCAGPEYVGKKVGAIVCFLVAPGSRRQGIAARLLASACDDFAAAGYDFIEAYARKSGGSDAENYHGPLPMYLEAGFTVVGGNDTFAILRKTPGK